METYLPFPHKKSQKEEQTRNVRSNTLLYERCILVHFFGQKYATFVFELRIPQVNSSWHEIHVLLKCWCMQDTKLQILHPNESKNR